MNEIPIRTISYIDYMDLPQSAQDIFQSLSSEMGIGNGEMFGFIVGESGEDSLMAGYTSQEDTDKFSQVLRDGGLKDGQDINIKFDW